MPKTRVSGKDLRRSLRLVIVSVAFGMVFFNVTTGSPLTGYARKLGASDLVYGILWALPVAVGFFQLVSAYLIERIRHRKKIFLVSLLIQRALWLPVAFVPFFVPDHWPGLRIWVVISLLSLAGIGNAFGNVAFISWMGDLVPDQIRGRFFSSRSLVYTVTGSLGGLAASYFLDLMNNFTGFAIVFGVTALFGLADIICFFWVDEPKMQTGEHVSFGRMLISPLKDQAFRRYMYFWAAWLFAVNLAGPFFNVYMLKELHFSYLQISLYTSVVSAIATVFFVRTWGRLADTYGNRPVMAICCTVAVILPCFWLLTTPSSVWVVILVQVVAGSIWPGIDVTSLNLLLHTSREKSRPMFVANFVLFTNLVGNAMAFLCGGLFLDLNQGWIAKVHWHFLGGHFTQYHLMFLATALLRGLAMLVFFPGVREAEAANPRYVVRRLLRRQAKPGVADGA